MSSTFPEFLAPTFTEATLRAHASSICVTDRDGAILWVNPTWDQSATAHGLAHYTSYYDGISGTLRGPFKRAFSSTMETGKPFEQDYECSTPTLRRFFRLRALPIGGRGLLIDHSLISEAPHLAKPHEPNAEEYTSEDGLIAQCSNCRRVLHPSSNAYHWVPAWVASPQSNTSHVICPLCAGFYYVRRG